MYIYPAGLPVVLLTFHPLFIQPPLALSGWERRSSPFCAVSLLNEPAGKRTVRSAARLRSKVIHYSMMGALLKASERRIRPVSNTKYLGRLVVRAQREYLCCESSAGQRHRNERLHPFELYI